MYAIGHRISGSGSKPPGEGFLARRSVGVVDYVKVFQVFMSELRDA